MECYIVDIYIISLTAIQFHIMKNETFVALYSVTRNKKHAVSLHATNGVLYTICRGKGALRGRGVRAGELFRKR